MAVVTEQAPTLTLKGKQQQITNFLPVGFKLHTLGEINCYTRLSRKKMGR